MNDAWTLGFSIKEARLVGVKIRGFRSSYVSRTLNQNERPREEEYLAERYPGNLMARLLSFAPLLMVDGALGQRIRAPNRPTGIDFGATD